MKANRSIKNFIFYINFFVATSVLSQEFVIKENGINPKFISIKIDSIAKRKLYNKTLRWIEENEKRYKLSVDNKTENKIINLTSIKGNAVNLDKKYFNVKYTIRIVFKNEHYKFEPTEIKLKVNSKFDMGWKEFDLTNGSMYFKKGKVIKKYKSYIQDITTLLNELNYNLSNNLKNN